MWSIRAGRVWVFHSFVEDHIVGTTPFLCYSTATHSINIVLREKAISFFLLPCTCKDTIFRRHLLLEIKILTINESRLPRTLLLPLRQLVIKLGMAFTTNSLATMRSICIPLITIVKPRNASISLYIMSCQEHSLVSFGLQRLRKSLD